MSVHFDLELLNHIRNRDHEQAKLLISKLSSDFYKLSDDYGNTLLHYAARCGNNIIATFLLDAGALIDAQNKDGKTPLIIAMENCNARYMEDPFRMSELLLDANADINIRDKSGNNVLYLSINRFLANEVWRKMLHKVETDYNYDYEKMTNMLIDINCDLDDAMYVGCAEVTKIMLKRGYNPNERCDCEAPLHLAVKFMHLENVKLLIEYGADVNILSMSTPNASPIAYIDVRYNDVNCVLGILKVLLDKGAKMYVPGEYSGDIMQMRNVFRKGNRDVIRLLMKYDIDLNIQDEDGQTAIHKLAQNKNPGVFEELRGKTIDVNVRAESNLTPLWYAMENPKSVKFLLDVGAEINVDNKYGIMPLMKPFERVRDEQAYLESIELLLLYGADVEMINYKGQTIFDAFVNHVDNFELMKPILAHLAIFQVSGKPIIKSASKLINDYMVLRFSFDSYVYELQEMKIMPVWGSITLYNLLIDREDKIALYMRNEELVLKLSCLDGKFGLTSYYHKLLRKRVTEAMKTAKMKEGAAMILCKMIGFSCSANSVVIDKIIDYLDFDGMKMLHYIYK